MNSKIPASVLKMNREEIKEYILQARERETAKVPTSIEKYVDVTELRFGKYQCYRLMPRRNLSGISIFYVYASAYCYHMDEAEWSFIAKLADAVNCEIYLPMYPLAPEHGCKELFSFLCDCYHKIALDKDIEQLVLMGSSVGGGYALSIALLAWKEGYRKPDQLIMLSPALDSEFFDTKLEKKMQEAGLPKNGRLFYTPGFKDFLNAYWVRDYVAKTEYTSPFYEDCTDICDDVILFSGTDDFLNCYSREFYNHAKRDGINIRFFEFEDEDHNFLLYKDSAEQKKAFSFLKDVLKHTYEAASTLYELYPVKLMAGWSKNFPDSFQDAWAEKFTYDNRFDFSGISTKLSEYNNIRMAAAACACDAVTKKYIVQYPNCTVINLGCRLSNTFQRLDNGRILWYSVDTHNIMSIRRFMYGDRPREKTIGRSLMDFSWIDEIECDRDNGVLFIANESLLYMRRGKVRRLLNQLKERFPGAQMAFIAESSDAIFMDNMKQRSVLVKRKKRMYIDDADKLFNDWSPDYKVISVEPTIKYLNLDKIKLKLSTKLRIRYNKMTYNHKIVRLKLGSEAYEIKV